MLLHAGSDDGRFDALATLHPDPVRRPLDQSRRRRSPLVDLPCEIEEAKRTGRNVVEVDLRRELESTKREHAAIEPRKGALRCDVLAPFCLGGDLDEAAQR